VSDPALAVSPAPPDPQDFIGRGRIRHCRESDDRGQDRGSGNVRMAGRFKGDVRIDGNFSLEPGPI